MIHELKAWPELFKAVKEGRKRFEYRKDDRGFDKGHYLILFEYVPEKKAYTGAHVKALVLSIWRDIPGLPKDYCIMDIVTVKEIE